MDQGSYLLGIDIGGTGAKVGVFSLEGTSVGAGYGEYRMISNVPGQAEHDAELWWEASVGAIREAVSGIDSSKILAVGVGCTNGLIAVDSQGRPLRSAIMLWDQRAIMAVRTAKVTALSKYHRCNLAREIAQTKCIQTANFYDYPPLCCFLLSL